MLVCYLIKKGFGWDGWLRFVRIVWMIREREEFFFNFLGMEFMERALLR